MKIAFDLEGTLIAECGEFPCEPIAPLARRLIAKGVRQGARTLLRELVRNGHYITLYSRSAPSPLALWLWCRANRLPVHRIIVASHRLGNSARGWPPIQGQELVVDDSPEALAVAWKQGVLGVHVKSYDNDWTLPVRETALAWSLEALGYPFTASLQNHAVRIRLS